MRLARFLESRIRKVNFLLYVAGGICVLYTMSITFVDVVARFFGKPIPGAFETCELALATMVFLAIAYTQAVKGHVSLDLIYSRLSHRVQGTLDMITSFLGVCLVVMLAWAALPYALSARAGLEATDLLHIPQWPFKFIIFIGALTLLSQFIFDLRDSYRRFGGHLHGNSS